MASLDLLPAAIAAVAPAASNVSIAAALRAPMEAAGIGTSRRIAAFVGQCSIESMRFSRTEESLYYSAERMCEVWPSRFPSIEAAAPLAFRPEALANRVYANRLGNGDEASGDGWCFRGAGYIQLTGRANQEAFDEASSPATTPGEDIGDYLRTVKGAAESAVWFWTKNNLNVLADGWELTLLSERINGGSGMLAARIGACNTALRAIGG